MSKRIPPSKSSKQSNVLDLVRPCAEELRQNLLETVIGLGLAQLKEMLADDCQTLCGTRYERGRDATAYRAGTTPSEIALGGRKVKLRRPRVRAGQAEVQLPTWSAFADQDPLTERAMEQMVLGVSTRRYKRSLEDFGRHAPSVGTSKSAVSRRFVKGTSERIEEWMNRPLTDLRIQVLMIDGAHFGEHVALIALGITETGHKETLGLQEGATENARACKDLLANLVERGFDTSRPFLVVIDGAKALASAVKAVFGENAIMQRCQEHKIRNVTDNLPKAKEKEVRKAMMKAYHARDAEVGMSQLMTLEALLAKQHPAAAASLREGLEETFTVTRLGLTGALLASLRTTNMIENLISTVRRVSRNVKRWSAGTMVLRWVAAGITEAQQTFRRIRGYRQLPTLESALTLHVKTAQQQLAKSQKAA